MKLIKGARSWRSMSGTRTLFWPLNPRYRSRSPLSRGRAVQRPRWGLFIDRALRLPVAPQQLRP